ncbi:hypothetical protein [Streptomyces sp. NBC_00572]|uniref:hypothetical protein n=1 Tax=Streptomyces sp. NBC_00572 TaxID=2903664 RepID=UPI002250E87A|nr:hypothetical protein [Streptomyces sp. NBC_00572]MCX4980995.1 hypothetical protein [Streptomyces sp. NBC_00572]
MHEYPPTTRTPAPTPRPQAPPVPVLHALWDSMHGIALWLVLRVTTADLDRSLFAQGHLPQPTSRQEHLFTLFSVGGLALVTLAGLL